MNKKAQQAISRDSVHTFCRMLFSEDVHAMRVLSLSNAVTGAVHAGALSIHAIGCALAATSDLNSKHAIKQVDRLLSNAGLVTEELFPLWVPFVLGDRKTVRIALDWTDFEKDDQMTLAAYVITEHGRATPLVWKTFPKSTMKGRQTGYEDGFIDLLSRSIPEDVEVTLVADRGFASAERYQHLEMLGFSYVIRFKGLVKVTADDGVMLPAADWVPSNGRARRIDQVAITGAKAPVPVVVCVKKKGMKEAWCLASNLADCRRQVRSEPK